MDQVRGRFLSPARHFGLSLRGESVCVFRGWLSIFASSQPKSSADYATFSIRKREKRKRNQSRITEMQTDFRKDKRNCGQAHRRPFHSSATRRRRAAPTTSVLIRGIRG